MKRNFCLSMLLMLLLVGSMACAQDETKMDDQSKQLVEQAVALVQEKGKDYALKLFNASTGPFIKGELYVFAGDLNGMNLSHPRNRKQVGTSVLDLKDAKGHLFIQDFIKVAKDQGSGWSEYWMTPQGESSPLLKRVFIQRVPGQDFYVGAGYCIQHASAPATTKKN